MKFCMNEMVNAESDVMAVFIAVPLWPLVLFLALGEWAWKKLRN